MTTENDYTPRRVLHGLSLLPYLRLPLSTPEHLGQQHQKRTVSGVALEDQIDELADLERALRMLPDRPFVAVCLFAIYGVPIDQIADALAMPQRDAGWLCEQAAREMARSLGWRGPRSWHAERC